MNRSLAKALNSPVVKKKKNLFNSVSLNVTLKKESSVKILLYINHLRRCRNKALNSSGFLNVFKKLIMAYIVTAIT